VAFAGLSPICEAILRAALERRPDLELVSPWTGLPSLRGHNGADLAEILVIELEQPELPRALRLLLSTASRLRILGLSPDGRSATVFRVVSQKKSVVDCSAADLCSLLDSLK
jgi:hypothetical protein